MTANYIEPTNCNCSKLVGKYLAKWKIDFSCPQSPRFVIGPILKNYPPVSNLQFISKLTESAVSKQFQHHISMNNLFPLLQSSYGKFHSTECALLKVKNDILLNMNRQQVSIDGTFSMKFDLCGVSQGSCLGPLLFVVYASKIFEIVDTHNLEIH